MAEVFNRKAILEKLKEVTGVDLSLYSEKSLDRRINWILESKKLTAASLLIKLIDSKFADTILKEITVNTTELFRDPEVWHTIRYRILPKLKVNEKINIWHAGSSSGEEIYSMIILLNELGIVDKTNIFASDINTDMINKAKKGIYKYRFNAKYINNFEKVIRENPYNVDEYKDVPFSKYFDIDKSNDMIQVKKFIKDKPVFKKQNLVNLDNVFYRKFDLILCRNVLIYFNEELQNRIFTFFHKNMYNNGFLVVGKQESLINATMGQFKKRGMFYQRLS